MKFVVLPGFDGASRLRGLFAAALAPADDVLLVDYPADPALTYDDLCKMVRRRLPVAGKFCIIAESFSGPIAIRIAASRPENLTGVVFVASFAKAPSLLVKLIAPWLPASLFRLAWVARFAAQMLGGVSSDRAMLDHLAEVIGNLPRGVVHRRMAEIAHADDLNPFSEIELPSLYLRAERDNILGRRACRLMQKVNPEIKVASIPGPHFLLGARPNECAAAIRHFVDAV